MTETHHDRTKLPPRDEPGGASDETEGEGDAQIRPSPPNVERTEPPADEIVTGEDDEAGDDNDADGAVKRARRGGTDEAVARLEREIETIQDRHLRLAAEFDNYRRRNERERSELPQRARAEVVSGLLDVVDDVQRIAAYDEGASSGALLEGVRLVEKKLTRLLEGWGLGVVDPSGEIFDPATMEAMMTVPAEHAEEDDVVADVFQKGYTLGDMLIRPARVRVKKYEE